MGSTSLELFYSVSPYHQRNKVIHMKGKVHQHISAKILTLLPSGSQAQKKTFPAESEHFPVGLITKSSLVQSSAGLASPPSKIT